MITTNLTGNLGNHMWQYSVCRLIAEKKEYEWGVDPSPTHDYHKGMNQMYFMDVDFGKFPSGEFNDFHEKWTNYKHVDDVNITFLDPRVYDIEDGTRMIGHNGALGGIYQCEDYLIDKKGEVLQWFKIKNSHKDKFDSEMEKLGISLDEDTCIINFRGGEYRGLSTVILRREYWRDSINRMLSVNPNMKFLLVTDDPECARSFMPFDIPTVHGEIGFDFYLINQARWVILSNSTFGWWAGWLNLRVKKIIAPKYWARHNVSDGYWATGESYTRGFTYLDREGLESDYETCKKEALDYYRLKNII
jgi:hypothetical protein